MANFDGAASGDSVTGMMLGPARVFCARKSARNIWIVFFDGEEVRGQSTNRDSVEWTGANSAYGRREMAASMALSGDLEHVKAMILADMVGRQI